MIVVLHKFADAFRQQNVKDMMMLYAPDPDVVVIGSDAHEKCVGINEITALFNEYFDTFEAMSLDLWRSMVSTAGPVVWVAADDVITLKASDQELTKHGRLTFVLEKRGDTWLILQVHHSVP